MRTRYLEDSSTSHSILSSRRSSSDRTSDDPSGTRAGNSQCSVISIYHVCIASTMYIVAVTWSKILVNHSFTLTVEKDEDNNPIVTCKIDLKPWPFWSKKGFKPLNICGHHVDIFWDLRSAKFSHGPEPLGGYYVAMVCLDEVVFVLGDCKKEAYKRTKSRPSLVDAVLVSKRENVFGKKCFTTRARFDERKKKEHDIVVENCMSGPKEPEMWISVDGTVLIHVGNLLWNFRGNETILIERMPVQVLWDVHDWLFGTPGTGYALFIFKPGMLPERGSDRDGQGKEITDRSSTSARVRLPEFCFFLYAWKVE